MCYAECVMLNVNLLSVGMLSVVMSSVLAPSNDYGLQLLIKNEILIKRREA